METMRFGLRDVPMRLVEQVRSLAVEDRRSVNAEAIVLLEEAVAERRAGEAVEQP